MDLFVGWKHRPVGVEEAFGPELRGEAEETDLPQVFQQVRGYRSGPSLFGNRLRGLSRQAGLWEGGWQCFRPLHEIHVTPSGRFQSFLKKISLGLGSLFPHSSPHGKPLPSPFTCSVQDHQSCSPGRSNRQALGMVVEAFQKLSADDALRHLRTGFARAK